MKNVFLLNCKRLSSSYGLKTLKRWRHSSFSLIELRDKNKSFNVITMGLNGSKLVKKFVSPFNSTSSNPAGFSDCNSSQPGSENIKTMAGPIVLSRQGSMFFDEDGDLAHEFYEEVRPKKRGLKAKMKRIQNNLVPQGEVPYKSPRLHTDYPVILHQA